MGPKGGRNNAAPSERPTSRGGSPLSNRDDDEPDAHTRHDPEASSSNRPELPLREDDAEEDEHDPCPNGLDDDDETVDYRSADGDEDDGISDSELYADPE